MPQQQDGNAENQLIVERTFELQRAIHAKNDAMAVALQRAIVPLLEHRQPLSARGRGQKEGL